MKKWCLGIPVASLFMLFMLWFKVMKDPVRENSLASLLTYNTTNPLEWINSGAPPAVQNPENGSKVLSATTIISSLFAPRNISNEEQQALQTWNHLKHLLGNAQVLPNAIDAIQEAGVAWNSLIASLEEERLASRNGSFHRKGKEKQCPHFLSKMNSTGLDNNGFKLQVPCGLTQGSSITIIGFPSGLLGNFRIDLTGEPLPGEPDPPIILHYNVRLHGDKITEDPVIVQNTWTIAHDWGEEDRCPSPDSEKNKKVDELEQCNKMVGKDDNRVLATSRHSNGSRKFAVAPEGTKTKTYFPFKQGYLFVATLRVGTEGIQMTVDGKHITSFAFRESLEPWLVSEVRVSGDIKLVSVVASGLPTSEDIDHIIDLEALISSPLPSPRPLDLFIGVFSTANNFKQRMAVRRTWMQYGAVRSGTVAVRFFVGLHKNQMVNEELWNEAQTYRDIQLMPFVDYYSLITWKTVAICIFGTEVASAKYIMKTDDDSFVRVDEVLASLTRINATHGLLYGLINSDSHPHRNPDSKWYISQEEWADDNYPPWAHGPGYVVSRDIAKAVYKKHKKGHLKMFKLEDVAMGIWIADMKKGGLEVRYEKEERIFNEGCRDSYVVAHYQGPREMLCLWQKLQETKEARCCGE
ncbi:beta-1,3-galactosyltransferase GALT1-like [Actinidia eriantha]|uniref:beta-1,3-galactosyltransferase GALT1-like n=1 Tax=Actinidia eriantha TaxID=165200 RepID=UPI00258493B4|nr:beta-1,3-galactosyltransferase GALT1-like [Actinidia eriantha]XP_057486566.1 beta-1,3-galactosyltransferase GALT1-like [Actinidia eriantha]